MLRHFNLIFSCPIVYDSQNYWNYCPLYFIAVGSTTILLRLSLHRLGTLYVVIVSNRETNFIVVMEQDQAFIISNKRILDATHSTTRMDWHMTIASISGESDVDDKYIA